MEIRKARGVLRLGPEIWVVGGQENLREMRNLVGFSAFWKALAIVVLLVQFPPIPKIRQELQWE
jgi:hypothetical protein